MLEIIADVLLGKLVDKAFSRVEKGVVLKKGGDELLRITARSKEIRDHLQMLNRWAAEISFRDLWKSKRLSESFVDLDLNLGTHRGEPMETFLRVSDVPDVRGHHVILGDPGAGKTTSLKQIAAKLLERATIADQAPIPILVSLRGVHDTATLASALLSTFGVDLSWSTKVEDVQERQNAHQRLARDLLNQLKCTLLIDGLDEVNPSTRQLIVADLRYFLLHLNGVRIVLTCRTGDFHYHLEGATVLTLNPLSQSQVRQFAIKWLGADKAHDFLEKVSRNPYSGSEIRPLTLAHLCAIYERSGTVPEKPRTVYRKIVRLLLEEWDEQRSVRRQSRYADFEVDRKEEFLEALAFEISFRHQRVHFSHRELEEAYKRIHHHFGLPQSDANRVVREIESHSGLVIESAYEMYEFAHKAIQEYLAAAFIIKLPEIPFQHIHTMPNEMALAVALSSSPTSYCAAVLRAILSDDEANLVDFAAPFSSRLILEKVDFVPDTALGALLIALYAETYHQRPLLRGPERNKIKVLLSLLETPALRTSVLDVLRKASMQKVGEGKYNVLISPRVPDLTVFRGRQVAEIVELLVDEQFLSAVGEISGHFILRPRI